MKSHLLRRLLPFKHGRVFFSFRAQPTPPTPPMKPDLTPLHEGNLLVCWAFLGGKLHCLYSRVQAQERLCIPKTFLRAGPSHPSALGEVSFIGFPLLCKQAGNNQAIILVIGLRLTVQRRSPKAANAVVVHKYFFHPVSLYSCCSQIPALRPPPPALLFQEALGCYLKEKN